jgi:hypothetical protein
MISESTVLRCIAQCLETSQYYVNKGNRPLADWWHDQADMYADKLAIYRQLCRAPKIVDPDSPAQRSKIRRTLRSSTSGAARCFRRSTSSTRS